MASGAQHCYTLQCKIILRRCCSCCCSKLHWCVPVCGYSSWCVWVSVSAKEYVVHVRGKKKAGECTRCLHLLYANERHSAFLVLRFSWREAERVGGRDGWLWEMRSISLRTTHSHLMLLHYFVVASFEWLRALAVFISFFYVLIWRMGEGLLTSWQQHKNSQKITANKFTTLTALPALALSLEWGYWHCSSRVATSAEQPLRVYRC